MSDVAEGLFGKDQKSTAGQGALNAAAGKGATGETAKGISNARIISGGFTALSSISTIAGGFERASALNEQARSLDFEARQASLQGAAVAINESIRANEAIGSQAVASPTSLTGSSAGAITSEFEDAGSNIGLIRLSAEQRAVALREAARRARSRARSAKITGIISAGAL